MKCLESMFLASLNSDNFLGREIISNLAKAAGLATMISVMRPDIDSKLICHLLIIVELKTFGLGKFLL